VNRAWFLTPLVLAGVVVLFAATWLTIPAGPYEVKNSTTGKWETKRADYPARLFRAGLVERVERFQPFAVERRVDLDTLRTRVEIVYSALGAVVFLVGFAFGAKPQSRR
jgi:hypothetical protein